MSVVPNDEFLVRLAQMFTETMQSGSVWVTTKRAAALRGATADAPSRLLVRASTGRRGVSVSARGPRGVATYVTADDVAKFSAALTLTLRAGTPTLKKREKEGKKGAKKGEAVVAAAAAAAAAAATGGVRSP